MNGGQGYGVRIRKPSGAAHDWAAHLAMMIAPIIGQDAEELEAALGQGTLLVAQGLPLDEAKQLVGVFQGLGAEAEVSDPPGAMAPVAGDRPLPPGVSGTQPFNMAGLRKVLEAARSDAPPAVPPTGEIGLPPADAFAPPPLQADIAPPAATRPFAPGLIKAALDRAGEDADLLPPVLGGDDEDGVPTAVAGPDGRRRAPGQPGGGFGSGLMGVVNDGHQAAIPETQSFGVGLYEPPPPAEPATPNWGALAGFAPRERFDPDAVSRLRGEGGQPPGISGVHGGRPGAYGQEVGRPARGASIADKPTDRLMPTYPPDMGLGGPPVDPLMGPPPVDDGLPPPALPSLSAPTGMSLNDRPTTDIVPDRGMLGAHPMVVQLEAPSVDPSETGTFTREASLDPLEEEEAATRQLERPRNAPIKAGPQKRGVRPGVYRLPDRNAAGGPSNSGPAAILSTGQMVARPTASPDEEVTDSGSFRILSKPAEGGTGAPNMGHSPATAALLSLVLPGMGQVYNGQRDRGMIFAVAAVLILPWLYAVFDAFTTAQAIRAGRETAPDRSAFKRNRWGQLVLNLAVLFSMLVVFTIWQGRQGAPPAPATPPPAPAGTTP